MYAPQSPPMMLGGGVGSGAGVKMALMRSARAAQTLAPHEASWRAAGDSWARAAPVLRASSKRVAHAILLISFLLQFTPLGAIVGRRDILLPLSGSQVH